MAKHVLIFGAGASVPYGAPTMANFLDTAEDLLRRNALNEKERKSFENVFRARALLQAVHSKSEFDLVNLESVFTAFELAKTIRRLPGLGPEAVDSLTDDLKRVIVKTLERTVWFNKNGGSDIQGHSEFVGFLANAIRNQPPQQQRHPFALLTFNYDLVLDVALYARGIPVDYAIGPNQNANGLPLLKLHGSLNWGSEFSNKAIVPWPIHSFIQNYTKLILSDDRRCSLPIGSNIFAYYGIGHNSQINELPVIVPPSWNKADSHNSIGSVWERAAKELAEAHSIYVVGYSLPETDAFFRNLYALGSVGDVPLRRFWVFNPDASRKDVFLRLLGPGARDRFLFFEKKVDTALQIIADNIKSDA